MDNKEGVRDPLVEQSNYYNWALQQFIYPFINTLNMMIEKRDYYTAGHQLKVSNLATQIALQLGLPAQEVQGIGIAALLHDIGKISVPIEILHKPTKLSPQEYRIITGHPVVGYQLLKDIPFPWPVAKMVLQHHEKPNGSGYPYGIKGEKILLGAKIICVADVVEAISSDRPYRKSLGIKNALEEITEKKGGLYDPQIVDSCLQLFTHKIFRF